MIRSPKPTKLQAIMTLMLTIGITNHVFIIPALLQIAKRDAWFSVLLAAIPFAIVVCLIGFASSRIGTEALPEWIRQRLGRFPALLFQCVMTVFFFATAWFSLFDTVMWMKVTFLPYTPVLATSLVLMLLCLGGALKGMKTIAITSGILLPLVVLLGFYVAIVNVEFKDYSLLFPLLEQGWDPVIRGVLYTCSGLFEYYFIFFLQPYLKAPLNKKQLFIFAFILFGLTLGPLTGAIAEFNPFEAAVQRYPAYEEWRIAGFGKYVSQTDFFSIYQWLSGSCIRISFALIVIADMWRVPAARWRPSLLITLAVILVPLSCYTFSDVTFQHLMIRYIFPIDAYFILGMTLILAAVSMFRPRKKGRST
ncbi:MAG: endospore germination permease [Paenibacillaceae bacterium]|uniref:Endospore germination permease n=1 Tax=Paenibacillus mellifer TaxID=2937794 RepID=A0A9X1Y1N0_9BACL|nr:endospore germination permease [Paenibacillus mellifer]MBW4841307.1 endospore germination permease [Paenibacillaceae bacterium]MCK8489279.1 endospore germination permease [Paenibacillus mellifer]